MENEKDLSDSEIESDLEEDIVFVFSIEWGFENNKKQFITHLNFCVLFIYLFIYLFSICNSHKLRYILVVDFF
jgi:hypothetical protein